jgi:hypothetical protein
LIQIRLGSPQISLGSSQISRGSPIKVNFENIKKPHPDPPTRKYIYSICSFANNINQT